MCSSDLVILVSAIAELLDPMTRQILERRRISAEEAATLNAKAAIVAAFDKAVGRVSMEIVGWSVGTAQTRPPVAARSEEHTSELQSLMRISYAVFCLKKKKTTNKYTHNIDAHITY